MVHRGLRAVALTAALAAGIVAALAPSASAAGTITIEGFRALAPPNNAPIPQPSAKPGTRMTKCQQKDAIMVIFKYRGMNEARDKIKVNWFRNGKPFYLKGKAYAPQGSRRPRVPLAPPWRAERHLQGQRARERQAGQVGERHQGLPRRVARRRPSRRPRPRRRGRRRGGRRRRARGSGGAPPCRTRRSTRTSRRRRACPSSRRGSRAAPRPPSRPRPGSRRTPPWRPPRRPAARAGACPPTRRRASAFSRWKRSSCRSMRSAKRRRRNTLQAYWRPGRRGRHLTYDPRRERRQSAFARPSRRPARRPT